MSASVSDSASLGAAITSATFGVLTLCGGVHDFYFTKSGHPSDAPWLVLIVPIALLHGAIIGGALFALVGGVVAASRGTIVPGPLSYAVTAAAVWLVVIIPLSAWLGAKRGVPVSIITLALAPLTISGFLVGWRLKLRANAKAKPARDPFNSVGRRIE